MEFYRRRLPHLHPEGVPLFITWRLAGSLPEHRPFLGMSSGQAFVALDRLLDSARCGPLYLGVGEIAEMVVEALRYGEGVMGHYELHAFVVMPNHVHVLLTAWVAVPKLLRSLKGITAKRGNRILGLTGRAFWQEESFDRAVRDGREFDRIRRYIEENPVRAGLVGSAEEFRWSSAWKGWGEGQPGGWPRDRGPAPHL